MSHSHSRNKGHGKLIVAVLVAAIALGAVAMVTSGKTVQFSIGSETQGQQNTGNLFGQVPPKQGEPYEGSAQFDTSGFDALETGVTFVDDDYTASYWRKDTTTGKFFPLGTASDVSSNVNPARATFGLLKTDTKIYMAVAPQDGGASDTMYVAAEATKQANPTRILSYDFFNIDGDTDMEWVFEIDATGIGETGRDALIPNVPMQVLFYDEVTTFSVVTGGVVHASTGTKLNTLRQTFTFSEDASTDAQIEYRVTMNQTDYAGYWDPANSWIEVPNKGKLMFTEATEAGVEGSNYVYKWKLGSTMGKSNFVSVPDGGDTTLNAYVYITSQFDAATDGIQMTYQVTSYTPAQGFTTASDCTKISGYSSGATNC